MSTPAQLAANIANAQLSTGPVTADGKARSAINSPNLGFYAKQAVLLTAEDQQRFDTLTASFEYELRPYTPVEKAIFAQLVLAAWNIERANRLEAELAAAEGIDPLISENKTFNRIAGARSRSERLFHKCLRELRSPKAATAGRQSTVKNEAKYVRQDAPSNVRLQPKIGRNQPCPCHSGKKYKQCCLNPAPVEYTAAA